MCLGRHNHMQSGRDLFATATSDIGGAARESDADTPGKLHMLAEFRNTDLSSDEIRDELVTVVVAGVRIGVGVRGAICGRANAAQRLGVDERAQGARPVPHVPQVGLQRSGLGEGMKVHAGAPHAQPPSRRVRSLPRACHSCAVPFAPFPRPPSPPTSSGATPTLTY